MKRFPVVAALLMRNGKVFLSKRPEGKIRGGFWEFPGGKLEGAETPREALARELLEELGIQVEVGELLAEVEYDYPDVSIRLSCYRCEILKGDPRSLEDQEIDWFQPEEVETLTLAPADRLLWEQLRRKLPLQS